MNKPLDTDIPMNNSTTQTIAVVGGTRGTGRLLVDAALAAGHRVRVLARSEVDIPGATVLRGDARSVEAVRPLVAGADAVVIALGAPPKDTSGLREAGTRAVVAAMESEGVDRVVALSMMGIGDSKAAMDWFTRVLVIGLWL